jgi:hypothetical protein
VKDTHFLQHPLSILTLVYLIIFSFFLSHYLFQATRTLSTEGDSLAYHIPIARNHLQLTFSNLETAEQPLNSLLYYYPAASHLILSLFLLISQPHFFNLVGVLLLFISTFAVGRELKLCSFQALIPAVVIATFTSVHRLVLTQKIDIYLAVWCITSLLFLLQIERGKKVFLPLGISLGMLIGTKYTGPVLALLLIIAFHPIWKKLHHPKNLFSILIPIIVLGTSWYVRNFMERGDFLFPASHPNIHLSQLHAYQIMLNPTTTFSFFSALNSEFSVWPIVLMFILSLTLLKKIALDRNEKRLLFLSIAGLCLYLVSPSAAINVISDLRYSIPAFAAVVLLSFKLAKKHEQFIILSCISLIPILGNLSLNFSHHPKLILLTLCIWIIVIRLISRSTHFNSNHYN